MSLSNNDIQALITEKNKEIYQTLFNLVMKEYESILKRWIPDECKIKSLGTCGVYLSSITELLYTTNDLLNKGYIESAGCTAAALWERFITLRMILISPEENSQIHVEHELLKKTPWNVGQMVTAVIENEHKEFPKKRKDIENKLFYLQYSFFCAIKHGNPHTISYLNRPERNPNVKLFVIKPNKSYEDRDIRYYFLLLLTEMALDTLLDFCKFYSNQMNINAVQELIRFASEISKSVQLDIPKIIRASSSEYDKEFWRLLQEFDKM